MSNYCNLPKFSEIYVSGGISDAIVAITDDKTFKYYPIFVHPDMKIKELINSKLYEINVIKNLTKKFIKTNKTLHLIEYYNHHKCNKIPSKIFNRCLPYSTYLLTRMRDYDQCRLLYDNGYPRKLVSPMYVLEMEKGNLLLEYEIQQISKKQWNDIENFLNRLFFQIFYTLETIKTIYPDYTHNDLYIRNILSKNFINVHNKFIRYRFNNMIFDLPANGLFIKIADFATNRLNKSFDSQKIILKNPYCDYFSILYDVYIRSLKKIIKNKKIINLIDKYFNQFINTKNINLIIEYNKKYHLDYDFNKTLDPKVVKIFGLKSFDKYLQHFLDIFPYNPNNEIIMEMNNL